MTHSFEAPLGDKVDQYGIQENGGVLALLTANTSSTDIEDLRGKHKVVQGLYVNFGQDNSREEIWNIRKLSSKQSIPLHEVQIPGLAASFVDDGLDELPQFDEGTVISLLHGIAADYALYNGYEAIYILEAFQNSSVFTLLSSYYFAIQRQLDSVAFPKKIYFYPKNPEVVVSNELLNSKKNVEPALQMLPLVLTMLSGGPDSTVLLNELIRRYYGQAVVEAIFINFGQPYLAQEILSARNVANLSKVRLNEINVSGISQAFVGKGETGVGYPILRNLIHGMYGLASDYARYRQARELHHANIREDVINLPWLNSFFSALHATGQVASLRSSVQLEINSEYLNISKEEVIVRGVEMIGDKVAETFSCLTSSSVGKHCGKCRSCRNRRKAFIAADVKDKTVYEVEPDIF